MARFFGDIDLDALRAAAGACVRGAAGTWTYAPLRVPRPIGAYLIEPISKRVLPLAIGSTLIAHEKRLAAHEFPAKWFEASWVVTLVTPTDARVADARATNGAVLRGEPLPLSGWSQVDPVALIAGDGADRIAHLQPIWQPLSDGEILHANYPRADWIFVRA